MALSSGTRLGSYQIEATLGAGGMGEVYTARDTRLDRSVAIKILAPAIAADPAARTRFEREARAVAALDHPHICGIYDVGESDGTHFIVMPLLEGQTLAARLENGPLPLDQALTIATQIADALDKAHRQGIVHRDLKPGNIMLTKAGAGSAGAPQAKLLDFGLAKLRVPTGALSMTAMGAGATTSAPATTHGTILGTLHYMAPEQVEGREADARSDIWALGVVLYEMLSGVRPFTGQTPASVVGAILKDTPPPLSRVQPLVPRALERSLARCLQKDQDDRWQSAGDLAAQLRWIETDSEESPRRSRSRMPLTFAGWVLAALALPLAGLSWWRAPSPPNTAPIRFEIPPPANTAFTAFGDIPAGWPVISPDGSTIVVPAARSGEPSRLWIRRLDAAGMVPIPGTDEAMFPFWSPDGARVGFFAGAKLKTVDLAGTSVLNLADVAATQGRGGTWNANGIIVFANAQESGLSRVNADGSGLGRLTTLAEGETSHRWPSFLPDGRHFVYAIRGTAQQGLYLGSLDGTVRKRLTPDLTNGVVTRDGTLLFVRAGTLTAQPFDFRRLDTTGAPRPLVSRIGFSPTYYHAAFSVSDTGILAYGVGTAPSQLQWMNRRGEVVARIGTPGYYLHPLVSPDGERIAVSRLDPELSTYDLWLIDVSRADSMTRLTFSPLSERFPVWSPDGQQLAFSAQSPRGLSDILATPVLGTANERTLVQADRDTERITVFANDWSSDGGMLLLTTQRADTNWDIDVLDVASGKVTTFLRTPFVEVGAQLSPNGRWLAYSSDESGRMEVYVRSFPTGDRKWKVSTDGGLQARWRADGAELFYLSLDQTVMAVSVAGGASFTGGVPEPLFRVNVAERAAQFGRDFVVSRDGQRFLVNQLPEAPVPATVVVNWNQELEQRVPAR